jgi:hypothetical protein
MRRPARRCSIVPNTAAIAPGGLRRELLGG